ncbi:unnamed protein product [Fusarium graminearum]|nr:unnamed protein product [Fusarium graminearum]
MSYHDRRESDPIKPTMHEMETSRSWQQVPQNEEDITSYNPYTSRTQDFGYSASASAQSENPKDNDDGQMPLRQAIKLYPKVACYCLAMSIPIIGWGYDLVIVGAIVGTDSFLKDYGEMIHGQMDTPGNWLSLWLGLPPAGAAIGSLLGGWLQNKIGRKFTLMMGTLVSAVAIACMFFSHIPEPLDTKRMLLTAGLTIQGFTVGIIRGACVTWVSENTPTALRGSAMALFPVFTLLGQLIGLLVTLAINSIEGNSGYLGAFGSQWILALGPLILSIFMPESPAHLIRTGQEERATKSATRLYAPKINPYSQLERIRATIEEEKANTASATYWSCLQGTNLRRTLIVGLASILPPLFGMELLSSANLFLRSMGMASTPSLVFMAAGVVAGMFGNAIGFWLLSRTGRRNMIIPSMAIAAILWGAMGITGFWSSEALTWVAGGLMMSVIIICGLGAWPAGFAIVGETSSLQLRSLTQGLASIAEKGFSITLAIVLPMLFSRDKAALGAKTAFVFCGTSVIGAVLAWLFVPEMKGRSAIEIDQMFEMRLPAREFKGLKLQVHQVQESAPLAMQQEYSSPPHFPPRTPPKIDDPSFSLHPPPLTMARVRRRGATAAATTAITKRCNHPKMRQKKLPKSQATTPSRTLSDMLLSIKPHQLANIISREKNHEYRNRRLKDGVSRLWLYETGTGGGSLSITHIAIIPPNTRHEPGSVPTEPPGIGNKEFNAGEKESKYAYPILELYELVNPVTLNEMRTRWGMGAPQGPQYVKSDLWEDRWGEDRSGKVNKIY